MIISMEHSINIHELDISNNQAPTNDVSNNHQIDATSISIINDQPNLRNEIDQTIIIPQFKKKLLRTMKGEDFWRNVGTWFSSLSKIIGLVGGILAFSVTAYPHLIWLGFVAGVFAVLSVSFLQYAEFALKEGMNSSNEANALLKSIGLSAMPDLDAISLQNLQTSQT